MAEIEVNEQIQHLQEEVHKVVHEIHDQQEQHSHESHWINQVAVSTGIFAGLAAIAAMQGNFLAEEAVVAQVKAGNYWAWYQSESIKSDTQQLSQAIINSLGKPLPPSLGQKLDPQELEKNNERKAIAKKLGEEAELNLNRHESFLYSVVFLQVAIALASLATLLKRQKLWYASLGLALVGTGFMLWGSIPVNHGSSVPTSVVTN
ncbi:MAG: DUF4337 domain-containing protein [Stigonema ocellatum SAG 48.90 = DSM 106950]|nr:DUF4337 domain-containing protein [Stigonema ocellatum SAG 48.90 = DSM 106950]